MITYWSEAILNMLRIFPKQVKEEFVTTESQKDLEHMTINWTLNDASFNYLIFTWCIARLKSLHSIWHLYHLRLQLSGTKSVQLEWTRWQKWWQICTKMLAFLDFSQTTVCGGEPGPSFQMRGLEQMLSLKRQDIFQGVKWITYNWTIRPRQIWATL